MKIKKNYTGNTIVNCKSAKRTFVIFPRFILTIFTSLTSLVFHVSGYHAIN